MPRRPNALKLAFLTAALGLIILCLTVLACAPSAPPGQKSGQTEPETTPETTATAEAAASNTPTTEPTATATVTAAPANSKIEPMLNALATQSQSAGAQGATGKTARMVKVDIDGAGTTESVRIANWEAINRLVTNNGGANIGEDEYSIPVSLLPQLSAHSAVARVTVAWPEDFPYPKMSRELNNAVAVWRAGATPQQAAATYSWLVYDDQILVGIRVADVAAFDRVETFFTANEIYVSPKGFNQGLSIAALVPVRFLVELSQLSGVVNVESDGAPDGTTPSLEAQEHINLYLYYLLPPNLRSQLSPLPTQVWELEGITPTPTGAPPAGAGTGGG